MAGRILQQCLIIFLFFTPLSVGQERTKTINMVSAGPDKPTEIPFSFTKSRSVVIRGRISGRDALLLIDTGSGDTYLDFKALHLRLLPDGNAEVLTPTGRETRPVYKTGILIGPYNLTGAVTDLDLNSIRSSCACGVAGIIGMNAMHRFSSVEIDFKAGVLRLRE